MRECENQMPRLTCAPPRASQVRGRRSRRARDLSDRATIVSRGCRSWLGTCLDTPLAVVLGMNGALWVTQTCLVVPRYSHHAATRRERDHQSPRFTFDPPRSSHVRGRRPQIGRASCRAIVCTYV